MSAPGFLAHQGRLGDEAGRLDEVELLRRPLRETGFDRPQIFETGPQPAARAVDGGALRRRAADVITGALRRTTVDERRPRAGSHARNPLEARRALDVAGHALREHQSLEE